VSDTRTQVTSGGIGFFGLLTVVLIALAVAALS
jgi:hypothetical protein